MPSQPRNMPEQEHSIKVRSNELYVEDTPVVPARATKPFPVYLRETPARPLSPGIKAIFWVLGIIVAVLFLAAIWRVAHRQVPKRPGRQARRQGRRDARPRTGPRRAGLPLSGGVARGDPARMDAVGRESAIECLS